MCEKGSGIMVALKNKKFGWITILLTLVADHRKRELVRVWNLPLENNRMVYRV